MDLRKYNLSNEKIDLAKNTLFYQPFIISDDIQTGVAYDWRHGRGVFQMNRKDVSRNEWNQFVEENKLLRNTYDFWIDTIISIYGDISNATVIDTACAEGYFLFRFLEAGAKRCIGYDMDGRLSESISTLKKITGLNAEFYNTPYDMMSHKISGSETADIVISSAIMVHLSDPTYHIHFLSSITKKMLFIFSAFDESDDLTISYQYPRMHHDKNAIFPICFSGFTKISTSLLKFGLTDLGFHEIREIDNPMQMPPFHKAFLANR